MRKKAISTMYALPCLGAAAVLYAAGKLRKQNKAIQRRERMHQAQMSAYERCLAEVDMRNDRLTARLEGCRQARARDAKENEKLRSELLVCRIARGKEVEKLKGELTECKEQLEHMECHHAEMATDNQALRKERDAVKLELEQVRSASRDIIGETMLELELVYEWIRACGYVDAELQNTLQQEFHGQIPSELYRRKKNEQKMQEALAAEPRDGETE